MTPQVDPRILLLEALWQDREWRTMTVRIAARLFPHSADSFVRQEILRVLFSSSEPKATHE